jgi:hypothetical protein
MSVVVFAPQSRRCISLCACRVVASENAAKLKAERKKAEINMVPVKVQTSKIDTKKPDQTYERAVNRLRTWSDALLTGDGPLDCTPSGSTPTGPSLMREEPQTHPQPGASAEKILPPNFTPPKPGDEREKILANVSLLLAAMRPDDVKDVQAYLPLLCPGPHLIQ